MFRRAVAFLLGLALIVTGVALLSAAVAFIVAGIGVCLVAYHAERAAARKETRQ